MMKAFRPIAVLAFLLPLCSTALAQFALRSGITGAVSDSSRAVIPDASVTLKDLDRNQVFQTKTNAEGFYSFTNIVSGRYQLVVEKLGFQSTSSDPVTVGTQQTLRLDLTLQLSGVTETVLVSATTPLLQTEQSIVGQEVTRNMVASLPALGRNFTALANLAPNISSFPRGNSGDTMSVGANSVVGGTQFVPGGGGDNGFYMNGVNTNDNWVGGTTYAPSMEAIAEVKLDVANFSAANGRDISTFTVVTRGGSNDLHGTAFNYLQNSALNAWKPIDKLYMSEGQNKSLLQRNQFGGNLGGPVYIPKVLNGRDKAFFFVNYEGMRDNRGGIPDYLRVPTAAERQGDFSELLRRFPDDPNYLLFNPWSTQIDADGNSLRTPVPNNDLRNITRPDGSPAVNADAQAMMALFPSPNYTNPVNPADLNNYEVFNSRRNSNYRLDARADYRISSNDSVYVNFSHSHSIDDNAGGLVPELTANGEESSRLLTANYARVFTPTLANEFIFGMGRGQLFSVDQGVRNYMHRTDTLRNKFFKNLGSGEDLGYQAIQFWTNDWPGQIGQSEVFMCENPTLQFSDNLTWNKGGHMLSFGFNYFGKKEHDWDYIRTVGFSDQFTRAGSAEEGRGGDAMASFLLGLPSEIQQRYQFTGGSPDLNFSMPYWGFYTEDKWKISPKVTLSLGLRYDLPVPLYSVNRYGSAIVDYSVDGWQLKIPGRTPGVPQRYVPIDKNNFAPRISLAYRLKESLVVRASYGLFYMAGVSGTGSIMDNAFGSVPGYIGDTFNNARVGAPDDVPVLQFSDIFPAQTSVALGTYPVSTGTATGYFDYPADVSITDKQSNVTPYYQRYLLEIQKELGPNMALSLTYLGSRGTKLGYYENVNKPAYQTGWASQDEFNSARPNATGRFGDVKVLRHGLNSFYNAVTAKVERNLSNGLQFVGHYTFSKTVADYNEFSPETYFFNRLAWQWNRKLGRGEAEFSHPHRFISALVYQLPWGKGLHPMARALAGGWNVSAITTFESGNALTVSNEVSDARDFEPNMPNVTGNPNLPRGSRTFYRYFNTAAFSAPLQDVKGNAGAGILRGPGLNNWDISLSKTFKPVERLNIEFRGDFLNAFNHAQWSHIDTSFTDSEGSTFGWVDDSREGRIMQFGLRVSF